MAIGGLWVAALVLGYWGFARYLTATGQRATTLHTLYLALQLFTLESGSVGSPLAVGWQLELARLLAPGVMAYTVIQALAVVFAQQFETLRLWRLRDHVVICGLGRKGLALTKGFRRAGHTVVAIESDETKDAIAQCRDLGAAVVTGDATEGAVLRKARVPRARYVLAVCDDGPNAEVAAYAEALAADRRGSALTCFAHIVDLELCDLLRERELARRRGDTFRLEFFNVFESGARALLAEHPPFIPAADGEPHLLVVGLGRMGQTLVAHAARDWAEHHGDDGRLLRVTA
ncbi:MAG: NAD-binding protein, partial [Planctomycetota bacterium]